MLCNEETVLARPPTSSVVDVDWLVMFSNDLYHVILACGLLADVVHVRFISCPAVNVIDVGVNVTDVTGTA